MKFSSFIQVALILLISIVVSTTYAQTFSTDAGMSAGLDINSKGEISQVQGTASIEPQLKFEDLSNLEVSAVALTLIKEELPSFYVGSQIGLPIWVNNNAAQNSVSLTGRYLYGSGGQQLFGTGLDYTMNRTVASLTADWNYTMKTALVLIGVKYKFLE